MESGRKCGCVGTRVKKGFVRYRECAPEMEDCTIWSKGIKKVESAKAKCGTLDIKCEDQIPSTPVSL